MLLPTPIAIPDMIDPPIPDSKPPPVDAGAGAEVIGAAAAGLTTAGALDAPCLGAAAGLLEERAVEADLRAIGIPAVMNWFLPVIIATCQCFLQASLEPLTTARNILPEEALAYGVNFTMKTNPVTILFQPEFQILSNESSNAAIRVTAPENFAFESSAGSFGLVELIEITSNDAFLASELICSTAQNILSIIMNSSKPLTSSNMYKLVLGAINPSVILSEFDGDDWLLTSLVDDIIIDSVSLAGFNLTSPIISFQIFNSLSEYFGRASVDIFFAMNLPDEIYPGDQLSIQAPEGFPLETLDELCDSFLWLSTPILNYSLLNSEISCKNSTLIITATENSPLDLPIRWTLSSVNPPLTPFITQNFWRVNLVRNGVSMSSQIQQGWSIIPQLNDIEMSLVGDLKAAGRIGAIRVAFTAISEADSLRIVLNSPLDFDFSDAFPLTTGNDVIESFANTVKIRVAAVAGQVINVTIGGVTLGSLGGPTFVDLTTFWSTTQQDGRVNFTDGFILPGKIQITNNTYLSNDEENPKLITTGQFGLRYSTKNYTVSASLSSTFNVGVETDVGSILMLTVYPFITVNDSFTLAKVDKFGNLENITYSDLMTYDSSVSCVLGQTIDPSDIVYISFNAITSSAGSQGQKWRIDTFFPNLNVISNTNDGTDFGISLVSEFELIIVPGLCITCSLQQTPGAIIPVSIIVNPNGAVPTSIYLYAPLGFVFDALNCIKSYTGTDISSCSVISIGLQSVAVIKIVQGGLTGSLDGLVLNVLSPESTPSDTRWYVRGLVESVELGWGASNGFDLVQMDAYAIYPNIPTYQLPNPLVSVVQMVIDFSTDVIYQVSGGSLVLTLPPTFWTSDCSTLLSFKLSVSNCQVSTDIFTGNFILTLSLNNTLSASDHAFSIMIQTGVYTPINATFSVAIKDTSSNVKNAAYGIILPTMTYGFPVITPQRVSWYPDTINDLSSIPLRGFSSYSTLISFTVTSNTVLKVSQIRVDYQPGVYHNQLQISNTSYGIELSENLTDIVESYELVTTTIIFKLNEHILLSGSYNVKIPVMINAAVSLPALEFYVLTFCKSNGTCLRGNGTGMISTYAIRGFSTTDPYPTALTGASVSVSQHLSMIAIFAIIGLMAFNS